MPRRGKYGKAIPSSLSGRDGARGQGELGNAIGRNPFLWRMLKTNPNYYKIDISLEQALRERRLDEKSVDEARGKPFFKEFYLCQFPEEDEIDAKGYRQLVVMDDITQATIDAVVTSELPMKMGVDIGAGGDYNVFCIRQGNQAWFEAWNRSNDTMTNVNEVIRIIDKYTITKTDPLTGKQYHVRLLKPEDGCHPDCCGMKNWQESKALSK